MTLHFTTIKKITFVKIVKTIVDNALMQQIATHAKTKQGMSTKPTSVSHVQESLTDANNVQTAPHARIVTL